MVTQEEAQQYLGRTKINGIDGLLIDNRGALQHIAWVRDPTPNINNKLTIYARLRRTTIPYEALMVEDNKLKVEKSVSFLYIDYQDSLAFKQLDGLLEAAGISKDNPSELPTMHIGFPGFE